MIFCLERMDQLLEGSSRQVRPPDGADKKRVAGEKIAVDEDAAGSRSVARGVDEFHGEIAEGQFVAILDAHISRACGIHPDHPRPPRELGFLEKIVVQGVHHHLRARRFPKVVVAAGVIGMAVGIDDIAQRDAFLLQEAAGVAPHFRPDRLKYLPCSFHHRPDSRRLPCVRLLPVRSSSFPPGLSAGHMVAGF